VATPPLEDPNFDRSVVYMLEHHERGALGVIINRPTPELLGPPLERWLDLLAQPAAIFAGGPVETDALVALAHTPIPVGDPESTLSLVTPEVMSADLSSDPLLLTDLVRTVRVFRGYAGWGPGQLESEIETGAWLVVDSATDDLFGDSPEGLWREVLRRQPGRLAWLANAPDDLQAN
jgi:putative transcriptional regulator